LILIIRPDRIRSDSSFDTSSKAGIVVELSNEKLTGMYSLMVKIRMFEERVTIL